MKNQFLIFGVLFLLIPSVLKAQTGSIWRMNTNITNQKEFNFNPPIPIYTQNCPVGCNSTEGNSTMDDGNGNVILQSDGNRVFDGNWNIIPNGDSIGNGSSAANGCLILPHPGNSNLFYVFTVDAGLNLVQDSLARGLQYAIVDMTLNGGIGAVISKNNVLTDSAYEKMSCTRHCNGVDWWVVVHKWGTNAYYSYRVSAAGIDTVPVVSHAGMILSDTFAGYSFSFSYRAGSMRISPNGKYLGNRNQGPNGKGRSLQLFNFNNQTGIVGPRLFLDSIGCSIGDPFCFSPNSKKVYTPSAESIGNIWGNDIVQYEISSNDSAQIGASKQGLMSDTNSFYFTGGIQIAIDGKLYVISGYNTTRYITIIDNPDADSADIVMHLNEIPIGYSTFHNFTQFPDCIFARKHQGVLRTRKCSYGLENETIILDTMLNVVHEFLWDFGDPASGVNNTSTERNPYHEFTAPGTYTITLTLQNACNQFIITKPFVYDFVTVNAGTDHSLCAGDSGTLNASATGAANNFIWQPGLFLNDSTSAMPLAFPTSNTIFMATQQPSGCVDSVLVNVNTVATPIISQVGFNLGTTTASSYQWFVNGNPMLGATFQEQFPAQIGNYTVVTTDVNGCTAESAPYNITVVNINANQNNNTTIYPNPANNELFINTQNKYSSYAIYDLLGKEMMRNSFSTKIDIFNLAKGVYIIALKGADGLVQKMWVKE
jgi:PKD repeat protein